MIRRFVERCPNGLPFAHNKSRGSRRYRAVHSDIAGPCEHSGSGPEGQHRKTMQAITTEKRTTTMRCKGTAYCLLPASALGASAVAASANRRSDPDLMFLGTTRYVPLSAVLTSTGQLHQPHGGTVLPARKNEPRTTNRPNIVGLEHHCGARQELDFSTLAKAGQLWIEVDRREF